MGKALLDSYLVGDGFIAMYKKHQGVKKLAVKEQEQEEQREEAEVVDATKKVAMDLDEDDKGDAMLADKAMFSWLKSKYGSDIPEEHDNEEEEYDYTDLYKQIFDDEEKKEAQEKAMHAKKRKIERDDGKDEEEMNRLEDELALEELEQNQAMTEAEGIKLGNEMMMNDLENENLILPEGVEFESNDDDDISDYLGDEAGEETGADMAFLREEDDESDENKESSEDMGDFFA